MTMTDAYRRTRESLHAVAEQLLAGPEYRTSATIRLAAAPGGFATVKAPNLAVREDLLLLDGDPVGKLPGATIAGLAAAAGIESGMPDGVYTDVTGFDPAAELWIDPDQARILARALERGDGALRALAPDHTPVLWPEHFDIGIDLDEVNYGVSPGDSLIPEPYAYVGPWTPRTGEFWNQAFGASRTIAELGGLDALLEFFTEGRLLAARSTD
ncbi:hypothetical protein ACFOS0_25915 [Nocardia seriolae]|uniref:hypothetical protein n=1 Tax=Nocardia seriolae TaxID=37332 RepID=UPI001194C12A|nr:hypothetical protein [Nocardia seriolae]GEM27675.1 hypothetical protein NS2_59140 [Nocardia seriolae NBRC 15557]